MRNHRRIVLVVALSALALGSGGCDGTVGGGEEETGAAFEPEGDEHELQIFTVGMSPGTKAEVCKTGGSGLNLRTGPSTSRSVITVMLEDHHVTILGAYGSWYRISYDGRQGFSYGYYLCKVSSTSGSGGTSAGGGCGGGFINPAPGRPVTSEFGACRDGCSRRHSGIDLGLPIGTTVRAADGGVVEFAGWGSGYGYMIDVNHCGKYTTRYAHLSHFVAHQGQHVGEGATIAKSGNTGNSTGPHLHFEIRKGGRWGTALNPRNFIHF